MNNKGYSVVEFIIAFTLLVVVVLVFNSWFLNYTSINKMNEVMQKAVQVNNTQLERIRMMPYDSIVPGSISIDDFVCFWEVNEDTTVNMKQVKSIVKWYIHGEQHKLEFNTQVSR